MKYGQLILDRREYGLLMRSIADSKSQEDKIYRESLKKLKLELLTAKVVDDNAMPEDVIRFNSVVSISTPYNVTRSYQIVTPDKSDIKKNKISILSPMGLALFGYAVGDKIVWHFPSGENTIEILAVEQEYNQLKNKQV